MTPADRLNFDALVAAIRQTHDHLAAQAGKAVNVSLTLRNWAIGCYIGQYELYGTDRAEYGERLIPELAERLKNQSNCNRRQLYDYLRFYQVYPRIRETLSRPSKSILLPSVGLPIVSSVEAQLQVFEIKDFTQSNQKVPSLGALSVIDPAKLVNSLSYTHFKQLIAIDDPLKRTFYEVECMRGNWSVRELKRQIGSLYYERSGLSEDKDKLAEMSHAAAEEAPAQLPSVTLTFSSFSASSLKRS